MDLFLAVPEKTEGEKSDTKPDQEEAKKVTRALYLTEKYVGRWRQKMSKTPAVHLKLTQTSWLQQTMFSLSSRTARQTACNIIESIAQIPSRRKEIIDMLTKYVDNQSLYRETIKIPVLIKIRLEMVHACLKLTKFVYQLVVAFLDKKKL